VNLRSATEIAAVRSATSTFLAIAYDTLPLPDPCPPDVTTSHEALLTAVHEQPAGAATLKVPVPASFTKSALPGDTS
jgi:hypothetical protein